MWGAHATLACPPPIGCSRARARTPGTQPHACTRPPPPYPAAVAGAAAVFSKFDFAGWRNIEHSHHPIDWELPPERQPHAVARREPRRGRRLTLAADVAAPGGAIRVYSAHFEVWAQGAGG